MRRPKSSRSRRTVAGICVIDVKPDPSCSAVASPVSRAASAACLLAHYLRRRPPRCRSQLTNAAVKIFHPSDTIRTPPLRAATTSHCFTSRVLLTSSRHTQVSAPRSHPDQRLGSSSSRYPTVRRGQPLALTYLRCRSRCFLSAHATKVSSISPSRFVEVLAVQIILSSSFASKLALHRYPCASGTRRKVHRQRHRTTIGQSSLPV